MEKLIEYKILGDWINNLDAGLKAVDVYLKSPKGNGDISSMAKKAKLEDDMDSCTALYKKIQVDIVKHFRSKYDLKLKVIK